MTESFKILFLSSEAVPFAKTGGLADVAGSLPSELKRLGADIKLVLPFYSSVRKGAFKTREVLKDLEVPLGGSKHKACIYETMTGDGVTVFLIEREDMYGRPHLYGDAGGDYYDNLDRFSFFSRASLILADNMGFRPNVIHSHDWQTGLVPALIKGPFRESAAFKTTKTVFTIHNIGYQGIFPPGNLPVTGLDKEFFTSEGLEFWGNISLLKAGIVYSDIITTVSPTYAREIQTPEYGMGMEGILRHRKEFLHGILNGVDYRLWSPEHDSDIPANYSADNMEGKSHCKKSIMTEMGLDSSMLHRPLLALISRLDAQKGIDLLLRIIGKLMKMEITLMILGSGEKAIQGALTQASRRHGKRMALKIDFDESLAHRIIAGADIFLIPSRYEPCGLTQMYALRYGTVPAVRATGGLEDTISEYDPETGRGNGFKFGPYEPEAFLAAVSKAVALFDRREKWDQVKINGMKADFSWKKSACLYMDLYKSMQ